MTIDETIAKLGEQFTEMGTMVRQALDARDDALRKLTRALGILKELEDYCGERAEGGHGDDGTQGNDWNTAWLMTQSYANGPVPYSYPRVEVKHGE